MSGQTLLVIGESLDDRAFARGDTACATRFDPLPFFLQGP